MRSAGCCINDVADREFDKHVKRTAQRPVTRGAVSVREALLLGAALALMAFGLVLTTNPAENKPIHFINGDETPVVYNYNYLA